MFSNVTIDDLAAPTSGKVANTAFKLLWFKGSHESGEQITETHSEADEQVEPKLNTWLYLAATLEQPNYLQYCITETHSEADEQVEPKLNTWLYLAAILEQPISIEHSIYINFYSVKQVQSVYVQDIIESYNVFIFLKQDHYDEELMDRLLDRESEILDTYRDTLFNFHYLPLLSNFPEQSIPEKAILIFSR